MHYPISFNRSTYKEFNLLKAGLVLSPLKFPISVISGENVFGGVDASGTAYVLFQYFDPAEKAEFLVTDDGSQVFCYASKGASHEAVQSLIRSSITKFCLQQQGYFCLHAAGIRIRDEVILFIGQKGAGKSTLASYLHLRGLPVWCDDYCVLYKKDKYFIADQGETSLKINPDIVTHLNIPQEKLESVFMQHPDKVLPGQDRHIEGKYYFTQSNATEEDKPLRVAAVFFIDGREKNPKEIIRPQNEAGAFRLLMNEIMLPGLNSKQYLKLYFQSAKELLQVTPVYSVHSPNDIARINEVYNAVLKFVGYEHTSIQ